MASSKSVRNPPVFNDSVDYEVWKKEVSLWKICCKYEKNEMGSALALSLSGSAREAALELSVEELSDDAGVANLVKKLDGLFLKDENQRIYVSLKTFEQYKRTQDQSLDNFINEFERNHNRVKGHKIDFPDSYIAYRLLESANLEPAKSELIRTTINSLSYKDMKTQLRKLEDVVLSSSSSSGEMSVPIKEEPEDTYYSKDNNRDRNNNRGRGHRSNRGYRSGGRNVRGGSYSYGRQRNCFNCNSSEHWVRECPHNNRYNNNDNPEEIKLTL